MYPFLYVEIVVALNKVIPRSDTADNKASISPEFYHIEDVNKGMKLLGHIKKPKVPCMKMMLARDDKMYLERESPIKELKKEIRKFKRLFGNIIGDKLKNCNFTYSL